MPCRLFVATTAVLLALPAWPQATAWFEDLSRPLTVPALDAVMLVLAR